VKSNPNRAFTLLEVLIALSVLAISMLGVYSLLNQSISMEYKRSDREFLMQYGYERMLKKLNYPDSDLKDAENILGNSISYHDEMLDQNVVNKMFDEKALKKLNINKTKQELRENYDNITGKFGLIETKITSGGDNVFYYSFTPLE
jgi:prepilin-type N-terminal cleavage/methylation domain-containing protein